MRTRIRTHATLPGTPYGTFRPLMCMTGCTADLDVMIANRAYHLNLLEQAIQNETALVLTDTIHDVVGQRIIGVKKPYGKFIYPPGATSSDKRLIREKVSKEHLLERLNSASLAAAARKLVKPVRAINPCNHVKHSWSDSPVASVGGTVSMEHIVNPYGRNDYETNCFALWYTACRGDGALNWCQNILPTPDPIELPVDPSWINRAERESQKAIKPDLDLMAELYQLKDLKSAVSSIAKVAQLFKAWTPQRIRNLSGARGRKEAIDWLLQYEAKTLTRDGKSQAQYLKDMVGAHLAIKWAVLPTYQSCVAIANLVQKVETDYMRFVEKINKGSQRFYSGFPLKIGPTATTHVQPANIYGDAYSITRVDTADIRYGYSLIQQLIPTFGRFSLKEYINARTGMDRPLNTIWELIPYSFVVDYFIDVDKIIDELSGAIVAIQVAIKDPCLTKKYNWASTYNLSVTGKLDYWMPSYPNIWTGIKTLQCGTIRKSCFVRSREELQPHFLEETWKKRLFTLSELAIQKFVR